MMNYTWVPKSITVSADWNQGDFAQNRDQLLAIIAWIIFSETCQDLNYFPFQMISRYEPGNLPLFSAQRRIWWRPRRSNNSNDFWPPQLRNSLVFFWRFQGGTLQNSFKMFARRALDLKLRHLRYPQISTVLKNSTGNFELFAAWSQRVRVKWVFALKKYVISLWHP